MVFLALVPSPSYVATQRRELLPRGFTLTFSGGLFSVTASIRLLPSVIYTAGCPFQSGLSSGARTRGKYLPPVAMRRQPRGACGLHFVQTSDLLSFCLLRRHGPGRDGWCRLFVGIISSVLEPATEAFYLIPVATAGAVFSGGTFSSVPEPATEAFYLVSATCYNFAVKT